MPFSAVGEASENQAGLYDTADFGSWMRALYRRKPWPEGATCLFESTIDEPTDLLTAAVRDTFDGRDDGRFLSVFGGGNPRLIRALAARYGLSADSIMTTTGAANGVQQALRSLVQAGDDVLLESPGFNVLAAIVAASGATVSEFARVAPDFAVTVENVLAATGPQTRVVVLSNLHNPSGVWLDDALVLKIAAALHQRGVWLVLDEVYADFARPAEVGADYSIALAPNLVRVNSLTKVFGLYSLRCGWIAAQPDVVSRIAAANEELEFGVSKLTHAMATTVLEAPEPFEAHWRAVLAANRAVLVRHVEMMQADGLIAGGVPAHGCIYFPRIVGVADTRALAETLWRRAGLITAPGEFFGLAGHMRIGFGGDPKELDEGLSRLAEELARLRQETALGHDQSQV